MINQASYAQAAILAQSSAAFAVAVAEQQDAGGAKRRPQGTPSGTLSKRQIRAFRGFEKTILTEALGFYSDLQSLHSGRYDLERFRPDRLFGT